MVLTDDSWYVVQNIRGRTGFVGPIFSTVSTSYPLNWGHMLKHQKNRLAVPNMVLPSFFENRGLSGSSWRLTQFSNFRPLTAEPVRRLSVNFRCFPGESAWRLLHLSSHFRHAAYSACRDAIRCKLRHRFGKHGRKIFAAARINPAAGRRFPRRRRFRRSLPYRS